MRRPLNLLTMKLTFETSRYPNLFIYLFIWSTPPRSQQKAIIKGGEKVAKEWERIEELEETFLQYYIYVRVWEKIIIIKACAHCYWSKKFGNVPGRREVSAGCSGNKSECVDLYRFCPLIWDALGQKFKNVYSKDTLVKKCCHRSTFDMS